MFVGVNEADFFFGKVAPEHEDEVATFTRELLDDGVGKELPADAAVAACFAAFDGQAGVEQQYALIGPGAEVAVVGDGEAGDAARQFFVDVL